MIAPPEGVCEIDGTTYRIRPPEKAIDVLEVEVFLVTNTLEHMSISPREMDLKALQEWCAHHVVGVDGELWDAMDKKERQELIDCCLDYRGLTTLRRSIIEIASLPVRLVRQAKRFWYVANLGGCECPVCDGRKKDTPDNRELFKCMYGELDDSIDRIVESTYSLGETPALDSPWWLYQLQQAQRAGKAKAAAERRKERERKKSSTNVMKQRGYL